MVRPGVARGLEDLGPAEARRQELFKKGAAFLSPGNSGEPVIEAADLLGVDGLGENKLGAIEDAAIP